VNKTDQSDVIVIGGGAAGLAAAAALTGVGKCVIVRERKPYVGGRACSYEHAALQEVVDSQHVLLGCCTLISSSCVNRVEVRTRFGGTTNRLSRARWRMSTISAASLPAPFHFAPSFLGMSMLGWKDKLGMARGLMEFFRGYPAENNESIEQC
jgi:uncharacterized protein with NAD-binding domain and iron-sulfur cluster